VLELLSDLVDAESADEFELSWTPTFLMYGVMCCVDAGLRVLAKP